MTHNTNDEIYAKGGFFRTLGTKTIECMGVWLSLEGDYLRVKYLPNRYRRLVLMLFMLVVVLMIPFATLGGLGAIIVYFIINFIIRLTYSSKVEFSLKEETILVDQKRRNIGIKKIQDGDSILLGAKIPKEVLEKVMNSYAYVETVIKPSSQFFYQLTAIAIWFVGVLIGRSNFSDYIWGSVCNF